MIRGKILFKYVNEIKENYYSIYKACKILLLFQIVVINTQKKSPFFQTKHRVVTVKYKTIYYHFMDK